MRLVAHLDQWYRSEWSHFESATFALWRAANRPEQHDNPFGDRPAEKQVHDEDALKVRMATVDRGPPQIHSDVAHITRRVRP